MRRLFGSVRARATLAATLVVAVALVAAGAAVLLSLRSNLIGQAATQAERTARSVATDLSIGTTTGKLDLDEDEEPVQVVDDNGTLLAATKDLQHISGTATGAVKPKPAKTPAPGATTPPANPATADDSDDDPDDAQESDGGEDSLDAGEIDDRTTFSNGSASIDKETSDYRFAAVKVETKTQGTLTVYAGAPLSAEQSAVRTALSVMLIGFPLLLAVVAAVTWLVTRRALGPVEGIRGEMAAITASEDLARRVPVPDTHDEVARLARTTNETLAALETSVERQRRFVADASHELRSPIASLRTQLEVGAAHPELLDVEGAVEDTVRLQRLAADLLLLARLDAGERPVADARFDLAALAREEAEGRDGVTVEAPQAARVAGSRGQVARVLANLLDNARRHTRSTVALTVRCEGEWAVAGVADDGDGVPAGDRERIFERFVRLDEARARDDGGAGLGLAIARDVAVRHGGTLTVRDAPAGGALFELRLPLARSGGSGA
ncbi:two-component sensor kinase [Streptomyces lincolnensis]|uniref:histidine kinase n=1 Tax=Streptomyces lincolnensis TaxID=1915 RepID=A0A1B1MHA7_STRLN|nr:HAMP domain-containing sensor histidine kinase [Streptomyces lincolnensis]ANS68016.1 two-component sensor kinase [Streptomyces lincolnensis]AXG53778.1 two-component sensor kinase [Streptomyces lincolnensis]QMV09669.1 HAMP domain-containing protein [Streptomyces lincolnensis]